MVAFNLSPPKKFAAALLRKGVAVPEKLYTDYVLPRAMKPEDVEQWLLQPRYATNSGVDIRRTSFVAQLLQHRNHYIAYQSPPPEHGEAVEPVHQELKAFADEIVALNPTLASTHTKHLDNNQLYNFIWGVACSMNEADLLRFSIDIQQGLPQPLRARKQEIEAAVGEAMEWIPCSNTLDLIEKALALSPDRYISRRFRHETSAPFQRF